MAKRKRNPDPEPTWLVVLGGDRKVGTEDLSEAKMLAREEEGARIFQYGGVDYREKGKVVWYLRFVTRNGRVCKFP